MQEPQRIIIPTPFLVGPVNCWLLPGPEPTLVDVGPRTEVAWAALLAALDSYGLRPRDIAHLVITHAHPDHYGQAGRLLDLIRPSVYAHPAPHNRNLLTNPVAEWARTDEYMEALFGWTGVPAEARPVIVKRMGLMSRVVGPMAVTHWVTGGEFLLLGGEHWQVVHLPGHAGGQIGLWEHKAGWLIGADHLLPKISSNALIEPPPFEGAPRPRPLLDYLASLESLAAVPLRGVFPGHGDPFTDHAPLIAERLSHHELRAQTLLSKLRDSPQTVWHLVQSSFPGLGEAQWFLAISEILGHLDWLEARGLVSQREQQGVWWYQPA
jgi:glyoxylase-like metal-dependent hydrolase (beta-lactamase superfamily II)